MESITYHRITPFTFLVVPEDYRIAATLDWVTSGEAVGLGGWILVQVRESNSGESRRTVQTWKSHVFSTIEVTAKTIAGLMRWKRGLSSKDVERGFAGETTTPRERSVKQRIGTWMMFGERTSAVWDFDSLKIMAMLAARFSARWMSSL